ncbi:hypothetical protein DPMN_042212 [Dreissena polymorpha]|uniref:DZANK-type domain-containing protein n=1 Tax=Dreissena polymorpha TaxID=45954 RepID=A0A9D4CYQ1_DREPO|nr:hypothetical protein DPMN_042212 [Dreissena polymorpha]
MKCPKAGCETEGTQPYCKECGSKMIPTEGLASSSNDSTIRCSGKREDGHLCEAILKPENKFCDFCGTKVNGPAREQSNLTTVKDRDENIMRKGNGCIFHTFYFIITNATFDNYYLILIMFAYLLFKVFDSSKCSRIPQCRRPFTDR